MPSFEEQWKAADPAVRAEVLDYIATKKPGYRSPVLDAITEAAKPKSPTIRSGKGVGPIDIDPFTHKPTDQNAIVAYEDGDPNKPIRFHQTQKPAQPEASRPKPPKKFFETPGNKPGTFLSAAKPRETITTAGPREKPLTNPYRIAQDAIVEYAPKVGKSIADLAIGSIKGTGKAIGAVAEFTSIPNQKRYLDAVAGGMAPADAFRQFPFAPIPMGGPVGTLGAGPSVFRTIKGKAVKAAAADRDALMRGVAGDLTETSQGRTPAMAPQPPTIPAPPKKTTPTPAEPAAPSVLESVVPEAPGGAPPIPPRPPRPPGGDPPLPPPEPPIGAVPEPAPIPLDQIPRPTADPEIMAKFKNGEIDPNDYQLLKKFKDLPPDQYDNFVRVLTEQVAERKNFPKGSVPFTHVEAAARELDPELVMHLAPPEKHQKWTWPEYEKARQMMLSANDGAVQLRTKAAQAVDPDEAARLIGQAESLENVSKALLDGMIPTRSQTGRDLAYFRTMAKTSMDPVYWVSRAEKIKGGALFQDERVRLVSALTRGQRAQKDLDAIKAARASGDDAQMGEVAERIIREAEDAQAIPTDARKLHGELDAAKKDLAGIDDRRKDLIRQINEGPDAPPGSPSVSGLQAELHALKGEEAALKLKTEKLSREYSSVLAKVRRKEGNVPGKQAKIDALKEANEDYTHILTRANEELSRLAKQRNSLKAKIVTRKKGIEAKSGAMPELEAELTELQAKADDIKTAIQKMGKARSALKGKVKRGEESLAKKEAEWGDLQVKIDELAETLGTAADDIRKARKLKASLTGKIKTSVNRLEQLNLANEIAEDGLKQARKAVSDRMMEMHRTGPIDTLLAATKAGLLAGVKTIERNLGGSALFQATEELAKVPAAFVDLALGPVSEKGLTVARSFDPRAREFVLPSYQGAGEWSAGAWARALDEGMGFRIKDGELTPNRGLKEAGEILKSGMTDTQRMNMEVHKEIRNYAPSVKALFQGKIEMVPSKTINAFTNGIFRFQGAQDRVLWTTATHRALEERAGYLADQMVREGKLAKTDRNDMQRVLVEQAWKGQNEGLMAEAASDGLVATFNNDNLVSKGMASASRDAMKWAAEKGTPGEQALAHGAAIGKEVTVRFVKTPTNIAGKIWDYSPLGAAVNVGAVALSRPIKAAQAAVRGDPWVNEAMRKLDAKERRFVAMAVGRGAIGTGLMALGWFMARDGKMTGMYQQDEGARGMDEALGKQPGAYLGDDGKYRRVSGFAPITNLPIVGATLYYDLNRGLSPEQVPAVVGADIGRVVMDQPMAQGAKAALDFIQDPAGKPRYLQGIAGQMVPTIVSDVAALGDSSQRKPTDVLGAVQARVPFGRQLSPEKTSIFGQPLENTPWNAIDPTTPTTAKARISPVMAELEKLGPGLRIAPPDDQISIPGRKEKYRLTPEEYNVYKKVSGEQALKFIEKATISDEWRDDYRQLPLEDTVDGEGNLQSGKISLIHGLVNTARAQARAAMFYSRQELLDPAPAGATP